MINKTLYASGLIAACLSSMLLFSCESHEQKADDAFERVKNERLLSKDSDTMGGEIVQEPKKTEPVKKSENPDEWTQFRVEIEKRITRNENRIKAIKGIPNANAKLFRNVASLEKDNNDLRKQMDEYKAEIKLKWENFKAKMDHDVNEIDIELKDMSLNNK